MRFDITTAKIRYEMGELKELRVTNMVNTDITTAKVSYEMVHKKHTFKPSRSRASAWYFLGV
jgi:hypothetical protein